MNSLPEFKQIVITGDNTAKFLQGQVTCNVDKLTNEYQATAICNLKGRIVFGLWIKKITPSEFTLVVCGDCMVDLIAHINKFGAFSALKLSEPQPIYPAIIEDQPSFSLDISLQNDEQWAKLSIACGNYWLTRDQTDSYQPQEMRLHQRGGVDYDKGCYLGQEVIARIYFKSSPKSYLHRIAGIGQAPRARSDIGAKSKVQVINAIDMGNNSFEALVIARPDLLEEFEILALPQVMQGDVARKSKD